MGWLCRRVTNTSRQTKESALRYCIRYSIVLPLSCVPEAATSISFASVVCPNCEILAFVRNISPFGGRTCSAQRRSEEHTSELQSLMRLSYAVFCLKKKLRLYTYTSYILSLPQIHPSY